MHACNQLAREMSPTQPPPEYSNRRLSVEIIFSFNILTPRVTLSRGLPTTAPTLDGHSRRVSLPSLFGDREAHFPAIADRVSSMPFRAVTSSRSSSSDFEKYSVSGSSKTTYGYREVKTVLKPKYVYTIANL